MDNWCNCEPLFPIGRIYLQSLLLYNFVNPDNVFFKERTFKYDILNAVTSKSVGKVSGIRSLVV